MRSEIAKSELSYERPRVWLKLERDNKLHINQEIDVNQWIRILPAIEASNAIEGSGLIHGYYLMCFERNTQDC